MKKLWLEDPILIIQIYNKILFTVLNILYFGSFYDLMYFIHHKSMLPCTSSMYLVTPFGREWRENYIKITHFIQN